MALLEVRDLIVEFPTRFGVLRALHRISFSIDSGEILGIVGEFRCWEVFDRRGHRRAFGTTRPRRWR